MNHNIFTFIILGFYLLGCEADDEKASRGVSKVDSRQASKISGDMIVQDDVESLKPNSGSTILGIAPTKSIIIKLADKAMSPANINLEQSHIHVQCYGKAQGSMALSDVLEVPAKSQCQFKLARLGTKYNPIHIMGKSRIIDTKGWTYFSVDGNLYRGKIVAVGSNETDHSHVLKVERGPNDRSKSSFTAQLSFNSEQIKEVEAGQTLNLSFRAAAKRLVSLRFDLKASPGLSIKSITYDNPELASKDSFRGEHTYHNIGGDIAGSLFRTTQDVFTGSIQIEIDKNVKAGQKLLLSIYRETWLEDVSPNINGSDKRWNFYTSPIVLTVK